jgi:hypothetical protein
MKIERERNANLVRMTGAGYHDVPVISYRREERSTVRRWAG